MELSERKKVILSAVVHRYITTAEPVSSSVLASEYKLNLSSATIRNELSILEKYEYLTHPHTSAGRIPTDKGYRFYVDHLMQKRYLDETEKKLIINIYRKNKEMEEMMKNTSQLLSKLTNNIGVVMGPVIYDNHVEHVQFVGIGGHRILAVIVTDTGMIYQKVISISGEIDRENLNYLSNYINSELEKNEINLIDLNSMLVNELEKILYFQKRFKLIHNLLEECFDFQYLENKIYLNGRVNIMKKPEFQKVDSLNYILSFIEKENILLKVIKKELGAESTKITIGSENKQREIQNCSLITSKYRIKGRPAGAIMILGPTRMDYPRMISIAEYISDKLSEILSDY